MRFWKKHRSEIIRPRPSAPDLKVCFPWHVGKIIKNGQPIIADSRGVVVAMIMCGGIAAAERIVSNANEAAERDGRTEI